MIGRFLRALVDDLDRAWSGRGWAERDFPAIARDCLARARPSEALDGAAILDFAAARRPERRGAHAAKGVLPLFAGQRFEVFAHLWVDDLAIPHDHGWAGAFHVISGRSVNGHYDFTLRERAGAGLDLGTLRRTSLSLRRPGDTVAVIPSADFIHSVLYLDRPGVAISVRATNRERGSITYFRPGLGLGAGVIDGEVTCRLRALEIARSLDEGLFAGHLVALLESGDRLMSFLALSEAVQAGWSLSPEVVAAGERGCGPSFAVLAGALDDLSLYQEVAELRAEHRAPETRALLAALYLCDEPDELREALAALDFGDFGDFGDPALWSRVGEGLVRLFVADDEDEDGDGDDATDDDDERGGAHPSFLAYAVGQLAAGASVAALGDALRERAPAELRDDHLDFLAALRDALIDSPLCRALPLRAAQRQT